LSAEAGALSEPPRDYTACLRKHIVSDYPRSSCSASGTQL